MSVYHTFYSIRIRGPSVWNSVGPEITSKKSLPSLTKSVEFVLNLININRLYYPIISISLTAFYIFFLLYLLLSSPLFLFFLHFCFFIEQFILKLAFLNIRYKFINIVCNYYYIIWGKRSHSISIGLHNPFFIFCQVETT